MKGFHYTKRGFHLGCLPGKTEIARRGLSGMKIGRAGYMNALLTWSVKADMEKSSARDVHERLVGDTRYCNIYLLVRIPTSYHVYYYIA